MSTSVPTAADVIRDAWHYEQCALHTTATSPRRAYYLGLVDLLWTRATHLRDEERAEREDRKSVPRISIYPEASR